MSYPLCFLVTLSHSHAMYRCIWYLHVNNYEWDAILVQSGFKWTTAAQEFLNRVEIHQRFGGQYWLHFQNRKVSQRNTALLTSSDCSFGLLFDHEEGGNLFLSNHMVNVYRSIWLHITEGSFLDVFRCCLSVLTRRQLLREVDAREAMASAEEQTNLKRNLFRCVRRVIICRVESLRFVFACILPFLAFPNVRNHQLISQVSLCYYLADDLILTCSAVQFGRYFLTLLSLLLVHSGFLPSRH